MLILLVAVGDFGRIFAAGIILEAAARDAAEVAANEYLAKPPGPVNAPAPPADPDYYSNFRERRAKAACAEVQELANTQYDPVTKNCPGMPLDARVRPRWPGSQAAQPRHTVRPSRPNARS